MSMLSVAGITKEYPTPSGPLEVLKACSFELNRSQSAAVVGPSGSGKSTLLSILGTLETPTSGSIFLDGRDITQWTESGAARFRREQIGFVFQDHHLLPQLNARENVLIPFLAEGRTTREQRAYAADLLDRVGLKDRLEHRPSELSGGERQRVAIARALVRNPLLILADEPTGNLDRAHANAVADLLFDLSREALLVLVTHDPLLAGRADAAYELIDGRLVPTDFPTENQ